jgi:hypothetical protein
MVDMKEAVTTGILPVVDASRQASKSSDPEHNYDGGRRDYAGARAKTDASEIRLVRKLDIRIMVSAQSRREDMLSTPTYLYDQNRTKLTRTGTLKPILWLMYFFNYVDRGALAQAKLNNLERDLHMVGQNFNTAVSILTVGYVLMQVPSNMLLTRVRPSFYLSICMIVWSVVSGE